MSSVVSGNGKWSTLPGLKPNPRWNPVCAGQSIWIPTEYEGGKGGIFEFDCINNTMKERIPYPKDFEPSGFSVCGSDGNIAIVTKDKVMIFDTKNKQFGAAVSIPELGDYTSTLMIDQCSINRFDSKSEKATS